jgi:anti-anti-sigma factor
MAISVREVRGVYYLSGELDSAGAQDLGIAMKREPEVFRELVLDLVNVTFIDSMGVRLLVHLSKKRSGGLVLRYPQDAVLRVFELLQMDEWPSVRIELE